MNNGEYGHALFDTAQPHIARVYDYLLGGKDNYGADRAVGDKIIASAPTVQVGVRAQREVLGRVVRFLVAEAGVRQLIDVGSGLPTAENVHQIAQRADPGCRVVYIDNDPVVLAHARALLADENATIVASGDLRDPDGVIGSPAIRAHLDWDQPIGLLLCGILHHILDSERPAELTKTLAEALPPGSYLFIHHLLDSDDPATRKVQSVLRAGMDRGQFRTLDEIRGFFGNFELIEPGLVIVPEWRPGASTRSVRDDPVLAMACAGVARKPPAACLTAGLPDCRPA